MSLCLSPAVVRHVPTAYGGRRRANLGDVIEGVNDEVGGHFGASEPGEPTLERSSR
ncbi:hypothetical protein F383_30543 [Gossypium arboreum]|uniref:Uncharacterized protein n=1 Tax=Gossypium arboreum TaxID=29729 RepID=A0A0B0N1K4_GOSAR|nr:hypothetical protein F383_30543 [Gossypium arboreum]